MYQTYFWDFDGTLFDTYKVMKKAFSQAFLRQGVKIETKECYSLMRRYSLGYTYAHFFTLYPDINVDKVKTDFRRIEESMLAQVMPFDGAIEVCQAIVARGGQNFLLTHRDQVAWDLLKKFKMESDFTGGITQKLNFPRKPDPTSLNYLCQKYQIDKKSAVMVGDRVLDVEAGHNAKMASILFDYDCLIEEDIMPDKRVTKLHDILE